MFTLDTQFTNRVPLLSSGKKFSITSDRLDLASMRLKETKTAQNKNSDDFDKVSRMSAADRTLNFFQKR